MKQRNLTITLPEDVARAAKHLAVDEGLSLSRFVAKLLEERVLSDREYAAARERQLRLLEEGPPLGTGGTIRWTRDALHER